MLKTNTTYFSINITSMKKNLLFVASLLTATTLSAQITVLNSHVAPIGSIIPQAYDTLPSGLTPGSAGANQTWNYANINEHEVDTMTFTNPAWTPNGGDFPAANIAAVVSNQDGDAYVYIDRSSSGLVTIGQAVDFFGTGSPVSIPLNPNQVIINFPANYLDTYSGTSGFDVTMDGSTLNIDSIRLKQVMDRAYTIDGWGSITTPIGTYDALRIELTETSIDSSWGMIAGVWQFFEESVETSNTYDWWTADASVGFPVLTMDVDGNGNAEAISYLKALPTPDGVAEGVDGSKISIYPNPTSNLVNFVVESDNAHSIEVYDVTGQLIETQQIQRLATTFDMSNATAGVYLYVLKGANGQALHTGKFSVVK